MNKKNYYDASTEYNSWHRWLVRKVPITSLIFIIISFVSGYPDKVIYTLFAFTLISFFLSLYAFGCPRCGDNIFYSSTVQHNMAPKKIPLIESFTICGKEAACNNCGAILKRKKTSRFFKNE